MTGGPFAGPPDSEWDEWVKEVAETLKPLGKDGYIIVYALTCLAETAGDWLLYETTAELNRAMGAVIKLTDGSDLPGGAVEYGNNERSCYPGMGNADEADALRGLLDVTRRWHLAEPAEASDAVD